MSDILPNDYEPEPRVTTGRPFRSLKRGSAVAFLFSVVWLLSSEISRQRVAWEQQTLNPASSQIRQLPKNEQSPSAARRANPLNEAAPSLLAKSFEPPEKENPSSESEKRLATSKREAIAGFHSRRVRRAVVAPKERDDAEQLGDEDKPKDALGDVEIDRQKDEKETNLSATAADESAEHPAIRKASFVEPVVSETADVEEAVQTRPTKRRPLTAIKTKPASPKNARDDDDEASEPPLPPDIVPFEVVEPVGEIAVMMRRTKLLQFKKPFHRTAVVDAGICEILQISPQEVSIIPKGVGRTHLTLWFEGAPRPQIYLVTVKPDGGAADQNRKPTEKLEEIVKELFPDSKVRLSVTAHEVVVRGEAKDSEEATQILAMNGLEATVPMNKMDSQEAGARQTIHEVMPRSIPTPKQSVNTTPPRPQPFDLRDGPIFVGPFGHGR